MLADMSRPPVSTDPPFCTDIDFVEVDLDMPAKARIVIRLSDGLSLLLESAAGIDLACHLVRAMRQHPVLEGGRPC